MRNAERERGVSDGVVKNSEVGMRKAERKRGLSDGVVKNSEVGMRKVDRLKKQLCVRLEVGGLRQKAKSPSNLLNLINLINYLCPVPFFIFRIPTSEFMIPYTLNHLVPATSDLTGFRIWDLFDLGFEIADFGLKRQSKETECSVNGW